MIKVRRMKIYIFCIVTFFICCNNKINSEKLFYLPNCDIIENVSIEDFNKIYKLNFESYEGINFRFKIGNNVYKGILYTKETSDMSSIENIYNSRSLKFEEVYQKLRHEKVISIGISGFTSQKYPQWDSLVILSYNKCNPSIKLTVKEFDNGTYDYYFKNQILIKTKYNLQNGNLISLKIYPINCFK